MIRNERMFINLTVINSSHDSQFSLKINSVALNNNILLTVNTSPRTPRKKLVCFGSRIEWDGIIMMDTISTCMTIIIRVKQTHRNAARIWTMQECIAVLFCFLEKM